MRVCLLWLCALSLTGVALAADELTVALPPGRTALDEIGIYRVSYQRHGQPVVAMPVGWTGHFLPGVGISYQPGSWVAGRRALLLHSPWMDGYGRVWVDYRLRLPDARPITFQTGLIIGPEFAVPGRSDGVTFGIYRLAGDQPVELLHEHYTKGVWKDVSFDLSAFAGQEVTLRLQAEPGPQNNPSWDYSYFGEPVLTAGQGGASQQEIVTRLMASKAVQATANVSLAPLATVDPTLTVVPPNLLAGRNALRQAGEAWELTYDGPDCSLVYRYTPRTGTLDDFTCQISGGHVFRPAAGGGLTVARPDGAKEKDVPATGGRAVKVASDGHLLTVDWQYPPETGGLRAVWTFGVSGKALTVEVVSSQTSVSRFQLGVTSGAILRRTITVPYLLGNLEYLAADSVYGCRYLDWTRTNASRSDQALADYQRLTDGSRNALHEVGYLSYSPVVGEALPNLPGPESPYLGQLTPLVMLDIWGQKQGKFAASGEALRELKDNGVDHLAIINHDWQRFGYDAKLPDHFPPQPAYGGEEGLQAFGRAANECGYTWSVHENYIDLYPDAPSYDPTARPLDSDGKPRLAWYNEGTKVQSFGLKTTRALGYAKQNSPRIHASLGTSAAYLDVSTCVPPVHELDMEKGVPLAGMQRAKVKYDTELFQYMRDTHRGPLFGEGAWQMYWAGRCDGVEAQVAGGEGHRPLLDFDLLRLHPRMVNHGMGYYERWFARGYDHEWGVDTGTPEQIDKYRAQELAYGHAGFIGAAQTFNVQWVAKEHHLVHPVQQLYGRARPERIEYEVAGRLVPLSVALAVDQTTRQKITYTSGLRLWVNWSAEPWTVEGRVLPQWGFLALGPKTEVCTVLRNGQFADLADCPEYLFVDSRTSFNMPYATPPAQNSVRLKTLKYLGGNQVEVTYEWQVAEPVKDDYHCFVHFVKAGGDGRAEILGQQDHALPKPTSQWRPGDTLTDGPYRVALPATLPESFDWDLGLYNPQRRLPLKARDMGGARYLMARVKLTRTNGQISGAALVDVPPEAIQEVRRADFTAHLNRAGTRVDFGFVATDGSVKINKGARRLVIFPYPRDKAFGLELDLARLLPGAQAAHIKIQAQAAGTRAPRGEVPVVIERDRLKLQLGAPGVGRYVVTW